jgi:hypothetical protein
MNGLIRYMAISFALLSAPVTQAMEIEQFDRMAGQDRQDYMDLLVQGAQKVLIAQGRKDDAAKVNKLFTEIHSGNVFPDGEIAYEENLDRARVADVKKRAEDPTARRLEVEDALFVTVRKAGIVLPPSFFTFAANFKPKLPAKSARPPAVPPRSPVPVAPRSTPSDDDPIGPGGFIVPPPR